MTDRIFFSRISAAIIALLAAVHSTVAFPADTYTRQSVLAQGKTIKIAVQADGLYRIPAATLRAWGFSDPEKVRIYGYPATRIPDPLTTGNYRDDLPMLQSTVSDGAVIFYAEAPGRWVNSDGGTYYEPNDFTQRSYYFVAEDHDGSRPARAIGTVGNPGTEGSSAPATEFTDRLHHERELVSPGEAGPLLVGEDFRYTTSRTFDFTLTGAADGPAWLRCSFVSNMSTSGSRLAFSVGGQQLQATSSDRVNATSSSAYVHGTETVTTHSFDHPAAATMKVGISFNQNGTCRGAWLNSLTINYTRRLELSSAGTLLFNSDAGTYSLGGASESLNLWDVTDPAQISSVNFDINAGRARWTLHGKRKYIAWNKGANLPMPELIGTVPNQNLHALDGADMVIVAPAAFSAQANRLAEYHASTPDSLRVIVADPEKIYNEFGSGSPDVGAIRRFFKMLYDRGNSGMGRPLRYAIMMARTTFDYRRLTTSAPSYPIIPAWMPSNNRASLSDNEGYSTDDICAMLDDGSGADLRFDKLSIAIGRMPATDLAEARSMVDKELQYARSARKTAWKQRFLFLADDEDNGVHLEQTEKLVNAFDGKDGNRNLVRKIYIDAYQKVGSSYPVARELMYRNLDEGVVWWNFIGHANTTSWTSEGMLTYTDINRMYLRHWPFIYAATCNFLRLDGREISGAEIMYKERYGGAIGIISAVRPVYISDNGVLSAAIGRAMAKLDSSGRPLTPGEIYRQAKNESPGSDGDLNRLRYIFMGDPALPLALPANVVAVDSIAGMDLADGDTQAVMPALARVKVTGKVTDPQGNILSGFNGTVMIDIFDAERSVTSLGHGDKGKEITFEEYGDRIYTGAAEVTGGRFSAEIAMPAEISQNFRPATMSLYAFDTTDDTDAAGLEHRFYVFGYDESAPADNTPPVIESLVLNHSSFKNGGTVNDSPMLIASIRDDIGINVSTAGVGHQMLAIIDGTRTYADLSNFYTPAGDGTPSGVINYPFENLQPGAHTLQLRVWDTSGNPATADLRFYVEQNLAPKIYDVYTDSNPASEQASFYLSHDQPDAMATVTVSVYNLIGRPIWSSSVTGKSDMFTTVPITWDLTDGAGRRVSRGIYIYRATITTDGQTFETASKRIAVTAR